MFFDFGREERFPTQYPAQPTAVTVDVLEAGFIAAFVILAISFFIVLPTSNLNQTLVRYTRIAVLLMIGFFLMLSNFGQEWEVGNIITRTPYKAGSPAEISASIGIKIGLRNVNVTLKAEQVPHMLLEEKIDYNERFSWTWDQGRFGFGPFAGHLQQEFRAAQYRGLPTPILWVMEYFVIDGEGFRFGRFYRTAGWYCHIVMWTAFACWLLSLILFRSVIVYAGYCLGICGVLQLIANVLWLVIRNPNPLVIAFEDAAITTKLGSSYWLTFTSGVLCIVIATVIIAVDFRFHVYLYTFFGVDPLNSYDEVKYLTKTEELQLRNKKRDDPQAVEMSNLKSSSSSSSQEPHEEDDEYVPVYVKRKTTAFAPPVLRTNKPKHLMNI